VAERTRIARELHDTLLQSFHGLLLQLQAGINLLPDRPRESRQVFMQVIDHMASAITEGRDTVQALRSSVTETNNLSGALQAFAHDLANESGGAASAQVDVQGTPQVLHPLVRDETFRIAAEALRNAFRHAQARRIAVEIRYEPQQLCVLVRDDGKGIEPEVLSRGEKHGHFGLGGMHERAKVAGGQLAIQSAPGGGTLVRFSVPGPKAYAKPAPARTRILQKLFPWRPAGG